MTALVRGRSTAEAHGSAAVASPRRRRFGEYSAFLLFVLPNVAIIAVFAYWPVIYNLYLSLTSWDLIAPAPTFVGLANYRDVFTDPAFVRILVVTGLFAGVVVLGSTGLGMLVALLLNQRLKGGGLVRTLAFAPHVLPGAAVATIWLMMFDPNYGFSRVVFSALGAASPDWMTDSDWALPGLILVYLWKSIGFSAIVYLAAMQAMPSDIFEAASIDGASGWLKFRALTVPLLSPTTFFLLVVNVIGTFQAFDIIAVMTGGGPAAATTTLSWFIYEEGFKAFNAGLSAAGSVVMFVLLAAVTAIQTRFVGRRVHYQ